MSSSAHRVSKSKGSSKGKDKSKGKESSSSGGSSQREAESKPRTASIGVQKVEIVVQPPAVTKVDRTLWPVIVAKAKGAVAGTYDWGFSYFTAHAFLCDATGAIVSSPRLGRYTTSSPIVDRQSSSGEASRATEITPNMADLLFAFPGITVPSSGTYRIQVNVFYTFNCMIMLGSTKTRSFECWSSNFEVQQLHPGTLHVSLSRCHSLINFLSPRRSPHSPVSRSSRRRRGGTRHLGSYSNMTRQMSLTVGSSD